MVALRRKMIRLDDNVLSRDCLARLAGEISPSVGVDLVVLDLSGVHEATTAAFAELLLIRRDLLIRGCDLQLAGLHGRTDHLHRVLRMSEALPRCTLQCGDARPTMV